MTKWTLFRSLVSGDPLNVVLSSGEVVVGRLQAIELEDGSGRSFNLRICLENNTKRTVWIRTVD